MHTSFRSASRRSTRSAQRPSSIAWYGCMLAITPSLANRGNVCRRDVLRVLDAEPAVARAVGLAPRARKYRAACESPDRRSRGPPPAGPRGRRRASTFPNLPRVLTSRPRSPGASLNGSRNAAVCEPSEPSTNPFSPPMRSQSLPRPRSFTSFASRSHCSERRAGVDARLQQPAPLGDAKDVELRPGAHVMHGRHAARGQIIHRGHRRIEPLLQRGVGLRAIDRATSRCL